MLPAPLGTVPGQAHAHACAESIRVPSSGWCHVDSSAISTRSHHHVHKMGQDRQTKSEVHTGSWVRPEVAGKWMQTQGLAQSPQSVSLRQDSQLGDPSTLFPLHPLQGRHQEHRGLFQKIIYKRPFASVFSAGFQPLSWEHRGQCSCHQDAGTNSKGEAGEAWGNGVRRPKTSLGAGKQGGLGQLYSQVQPNPWTKC